jgi:hypothetical protein
MRKAFVIQIAGLNASIYWAEFPKRYLEIIRFGNLSELKDFPKIPLHHTQPMSLIHHEQRNLFLYDFIVLLRFIVDGKGNVGFLRRDCRTPIHRDVEEELIGN